jgi:hypothetical protein
MRGLDPALAAWLVLVIAITSALSYVLIFRRDLVRGNAPPRFLTILGWLLASAAAVIFVFLVLVAIGTS